MTKFKQGEMPVCNNPHQHNLDILNPPHVCSLCGGGNFLNAVSKEPPALRPASPKWEPVTGQEYYLIGSNQVVKYIGYNEESKEYVFYHKENDLYDAWLLEYIRPIAPSPEDILKFNLAAKLWGTEVRVASEMAEMLMPIILDWHNRHKEGGGG